MFLWKWIWEWEWTGWRRINFIRLIPGFLHRKLCRTGRYLSQSIQLNLNILSNSTRPITSLKKKTPEELPGVFKKRGTKEFIVS